MKSKSYVENQLVAADNIVANLVNDVDNNRPYVTKDYLTQRLEQIRKSLILIQERIQLEDENP